MTTRSQSQSYTLADIADRFGCLLNGSPNALVNTVGTLENGAPNAISFLANPLYRKQLSGTCAGAVVINADEAAHCPVPTLVSKNTYATYARIAGFLCPQSAPQPGVHTTAVVAEGSKIPK
ncbi:MAG: LpxD N-terminal domain-containing protein, partial [Pseudomonadota bacterium]|nr:LpxD N-terminal domain-containing protein [Pseudomonadota bacterium]